MQHPDNASRAQSALTPFDAFVAERQIQNEALDTQVSDLVCNLLHLSDSLGVNPMDVVRSGLSAYLCEAIDPDHTLTKVSVAFQINGLDEFTALATLRPGPAPAA